MCSQDIREVLIARTITVIAEEGLDKTTTKAITAGTGINEVYIYRLFTNKEGLLAKVFDKLDDELVDVTLRYLPVMNQPDMPFRTRSKAYFDAVWNFLLSNKEKCLAFVRYYYSPYFSRLSAQGHQQRFKGLLHEISPVFREEADVWMILNHILNVMLDFAVKVHNNQMSREDDYAEHVFRVIYVAVQQYFKQTEESVP